MLERVKTILISQFLVILLSGCQGFMEAVTHAGDDGLIWPLPPVPARLHYDAEIDLRYRLSTASSLIAGVQNEFFNPQAYRVAVSKDLLAMIDEQRGITYLTDRYQNSVTRLKYNTGIEVTGVRDVAIDDMKRVYLLDANKRQIAVFQNDGRFIKAFGSALMWTNPDRMAIDTIRQRLYVADRFQRRIYVFSLSGVFLYMFGEQGTASGQFGKLVDMCVDQQGKLYVMEGMPLRIQQFGTQGTYLHTIKLDKDVFREPVAVAIETEQVIYIADTYRSEIMVLDMQGRSVLSIGGLGRRRGRFTELSDLAFDPVWKRLVTTEMATARLQVFRRTAESWSDYP